MEQSSINVHPAVDTRVDQLCDEFETAWKAGRRPPLEAFLEQAPSESKQALMHQLVFLEVDLRRRAGESVDVNEYYERFPGSAQLLRELFQRLDASLSQSLEQIHQRFKQAWQTGQSPRLEDFLNEAPEAERDFLLAALLRTELDCRAGESQAPSPEKYLARFPDHADRVAAVFEQFRSPAPDPSRSNSLAETVNLSSASNSTPAAAAESIPPQIARYRVRRQLGKGAFGTVWLADDEELRRQVAIKAPQPNQLSSEESVAAFLHEARTAAALKHPGIVTIYDLGRLDDGGCYVVMEYVEGRSLADEIETERIGFERVARLIEETAEAMHYAHRQGFVHRDLKPANILLDAQGRPHIADFGVALHEDEQRGRAGDVSGTLPYMSPEQIQGAAHHLDGRSDIWSVGVILYELLTGRRPFQGRTRAEFADEICRRPPKPLRMIDETIPAELERIAFKCLEKDAVRRYSTAHDLAHDLRQWRSQRESAAVSSLPAASHGAPAASPAFKLMIGCGSLVTISITSAAVLMAWFSLRPEQVAMAPNHAAVEDRAARRPAAPIASRPEPLVEAPGPQPEGAPAVLLPPRQIETPLAIGAFRILHYRDIDHRSALIGELGDQDVDVREQDSVRVEAEFNQPAYCFLVAFHPDGSVQLCYPADVTVPPASRKQLAYPPDPTDAFYLANGAGEQAFGLIVSRQPLPAFADWQKSAGASVPWEAVEPTTFMKIEQPLTTPLNHNYKSRGAIKKRPGVAAVEALDRFLRAHSSADAVITVGFPVWPEQSPANPPPPAPPPPAGVTPPAPSE